ncbi:MAG: adenine methylase Dam [Francisellaceae bacterium]|nr:adenine methylase Dam [Francisellaceae bacterium]
MKPLLKWAGGKRWLIPILKEVWQAYEGIKLVEPFTGGMAITLGLNPKEALLNDANIHLINFYKQVKKGLVVPYQFKNDSEYYYRIREKFNNLIRNKKHATPEAASLFYFLMKTGFNGLCRFNNSGEYNVPFGQYKTIHYRKDFQDYKSILNNWDIRQGDFQELKLQGNEFVYADPPYDVEFTKYYTHGFNWGDQLRLATWLAAHPGPVVVSNQATQRILKLYRSLKFKIFILPVARRIACNGNRTPALEMLAFKGLESNLIKKIRTNLHKII